MSYRFISQEDVKGKTIVLRVGIDSNVVKGNIVPGERLRQQASVLKDLAGKGAKIIAIGHQGREGKTDFVSLEQHRDFLEKESEIPVEFSKWDSDFSEKILSLKEGQAILLDNVRFNKDETEEKSAIEHSQSPWIKAIAKHADYFVQNAFSVCHRSHASVVGFTPLLPSYVGPTLEKEITALEKMGAIKQNRLLVLGGAKPEDSIKLLKSMLEKNRVDSVISGGLFGNIFVEASGHKLGKSTEFIRQKGMFELIGPAKKLLESFGEKISLPVDFGADENGQRKEIGIEELPSELSLLDIGEKTIAFFREKIMGAELIVFNGPMGVYEQEAFQKGTKSIFEAIAKSNAFSLLGGGDTETAIEQLGLNKERFSHISLAGKALLQYLSGKELPGLIALEV